MSLVAVAWPASEWETALITSALRADGIPFFVHGAGIASVLPGPQIGAYNTRTVLVPPSAVAAASAVLSEMPPRHDRPPVDADAERLMPVRARSTARMVLEALLFGWFVPDAPHGDRRDARDDAPPAAR